jgi:hypothetical protein
MPAGVELVVTDSKCVQQLLATESDYILRPDQTFNGVPPKPVAIYFPREWRKLAKIDGRCFWIEGGFGAREPMVFLGSLRRPDGTSRLVAIKGAAQNAYQLLAMEQVLVLPHPRFYDEVPRHFVGAGGMANGLYRPATLKSGTVDPADPSHVVFKFDVYKYFDSSKVETTGIIDAYLQNDDSVVFQLRETPELAEMKVKLCRTNFPGTIPPGALKYSMPLP